MPFGTGSWLQYSTVRRISSMFEKSICGSTPRENRFRPSVTRQTLPVRSPLPNRQPSIRSAPPGSPIRLRRRRFAAVVVRVQAQDDRVPRGARLPAHPLDRVGVDVGVAISTVAGRLMISGHSGVGCDDLGDRVADLGVLQFGAGVGLRGVLERHRVPGCLAASEAACGRRRWRSS